MDWEFVAPMVVAITFILSIAGVLILRPLTKRLGDLIEATTRQRQKQLNSDEMSRLADLVSRLADRLDRLEDRQDFTERMLQPSERTSKPARLGEPRER